MRFFIVCPAHIATGGTELLHQFSNTLTNLNIENYLLYINISTNICPTPDSFIKYQAKYVSQYVDREDSILVLPETAVRYSGLCQRGIVMLWWLSVDNYLSSCNLTYSSPNLDPYHLKNRTNIIHFVQSQYAKNFLIQSFNIQDSFYLSDYINDEIIEISNNYRNSFERENICLYNPQKGYQTTKLIMEACPKTIKWIPLINMKPSEIAMLMCIAKVYIDFGNHPGKDRLPREAAICGCCIITNKSGSAAYHEDVSIPEEYKFSEPYNIDKIITKITDICTNYESHKNNFSNYITKIQNEKNQFFSDTQTAIEIMSQNICSAPSKMDLIEDESIILNSLHKATKKIDLLIQNTDIAEHTGNENALITNLLNLDYLMHGCLEAAHSILENHS